MYAQSQPAIVSVGTGDSLSELRAELERRLSEGSLELPLLPGVAMEVTSAAAREDTDARVLADILKRDAAMAAHVLRVVNSPVYSPRAQIVSLQQAVGRVGSAKIREIALIIACRAGVFKVKGYEAEVDQVFKHSVATALFAQEIARQTRNNVEEAFLCGLLHDVGRPVLLQALLAVTRERSGSTTREEILTLVSEVHCRGGAALAASWTLPEAVSQAILNHHAPAPEHAASVHISALADALAHALLDAPEPDPETVRGHVALEKLEIYPDVLDKILARAGSVRQAAEVLS
jgi:putative nucleotidyltransferase with HDIG domain